MAEDGKIKIDKFDGYDFRKMQIEDYLYRKKLHEPLALGAVRLSLAKNVAYNVVNEKTTYGLLKDLSNMYEKPSASNKVFLIRQLVNTKMNEGVSIADHVNKFNSILSRLMSVDIKSDDEVQALLLLSSLPESSSGTVTAFSGSTGSTKLKLDNIRDLILREDRGQKQNRSRSKSKKIAEDSIDDCIMDSGASFHATYCKEELERFKLRSGKVHLADDKTLAIAGVGDVVLKTSFGSLVVARGKKCGSLYMVEVPSERINTAIDGRGNATLRHQRLGHMSEKGMNILALKGRILNLQKAVIGFCKPCVLGKQKKTDPATMLPLSMTLAGSHKVIRSRDVTFNKDSLYEAKAATDSSNLTKPNQKDQVVLEDSPNNLANKSIVTEHRLNSKITQSPVGAQIRGSGKWKKAINEEIVSLEENQTWSLVRLPSGKKALQSMWVFRVKNEQDGKKGYKARLVVKDF
ncbi:retrovirus-related pol polyprotein from transposon TNT 1-94 [Tanacetum coccineum]